MNKMSFLALVVIVACSRELLGPDMVSIKPTDSSARNVPHVLVEKGSRSEIKAPGGQVARSASDYQLLMLAVTGNVATRFDIDFREEMVAVVFAGEQRTAGYELEVKGVVERGDAIEVQAAVIPPAPGRPVAQVLTAPFVGIRMPKSDKKVVFQVDGGALR